MTQEMLKGVPVPEGWALPDLDRPVVAAYYFPNYHVYPQNEVTHGKGWTEWELMTRATKRFPGHQQPKTPLWGYEDEADPVVMAKKIDVAADHGIDCFIFDWYYYDSQFFLERCLNEGFLGAPNVGRMKFCLMWANHDWVDLHPAKSNQDAHLLYRGAVDMDGFKKVVHHVIEKFFSHPSYLKINGAPVFSIYLLQSLVEGLGSIDDARKALDYFREETRKAGHRDLHLMGIAWENSIVEGNRSSSGLIEMIDALGIDSATSYVWVHHFDMSRKDPARYEEVQNAYFDYWNRTSKELKIPLFPNVTMGWDATPRTVQSDCWEQGVYPFTQIIIENTPENIGAAVRQALTAAQKIKGQKMITINAWNEWTEGSYLEPDTTVGIDCLEAIRRALKE
jgi:hypothetical protein